MLADPHRVLVEVGPGGSLTGSATRHPRWSTEHRAVRLMRHQLQNKDDRDTFLLALGQLWSAGVDADWTRLRAADPPRRVSLPGYPFAHQRHWVEPKLAADQPDRPMPTATNETLAPGPVDGESGLAVGSSRSKRHYNASGPSRWVSSSIDRNANFFELGGDSVSAIGIATNWPKRDWTSSPQDLFENQTVAALAAALDRPLRTSAGWLTRPATWGIQPVPPNIAHFLEHGLRETGRWCVPLILRLDPKVSVDDVRAVLTAVTNHHDALRLKVVERAGAWEQHIAAP